MQLQSDIQSDVQSQKSMQSTALDWVGMSQIQTAVLLDSPTGRQLTVPALLDVGVDLGENYRGIHMSRLYKLQLEHVLNQPLTALQLSEFAAASLESQGELSARFGCKIKVTWPVQTTSLKSQLAGFRNYPIEIIFEKTAVDEKIWMQFEVLYSSTCPQSEGLSMEILKRQTAPFDRLPATPHAQRSRAVVQVQIQRLDQNLIESLIGEVEQALGTPVQTTVKKADEMHFAELNAQNLMFCEDAARKMAPALLKNNSVAGFWMLCEHQESLHPHNASSVMGYRFSPPQQLRFG